MHEVGGGMVWLAKPVEQKLSSKRKVSASLQDTEDEIWEEENYIAEFGDWRTHGKGHQKATVLGKAGI
eukprot:11199246-Lingulodinium_polyedra.AAC.1